MRSPFDFVRGFVLSVINLYQKSLSPDHGWPRPLYPYGFCRFYPSCSQYAKESIADRGLVIGGLRAIGRILRCNPWRFADFDPAVRDR